MKSLFGDLPLILQAAAVIGAFMFGGLIAAIGMRFRKNGNGISRADLLQAALDNVEVRQEERRAMYARMDAIVAEFKLSMREYDGNMTEFGKNVNDRLRALERTVDRHMGSRDQR